MPERAPASGKDTLSDLPRAPDWGPMRSTTILREFSAFSPISSRVISSIYYLIQIAEAQFGICRLGAKLLCREWTGGRGTSWVVLYSPSATVVGGAINMAPLYCARVLHTRRLFGCK